MALVSNRNAAALGLHRGSRPCCPHAVAAVGYQKPDRKFSSQKIQKSSKSLLTLWTPPDYIRLTNEGGAPLATKKFASKSALCEIQESRVSDTR
ncbi:hypothetical protein EN859_006210 [Mesorhizobium sp. M00.F.Ca.ET.216.01.1.1]|nr:hypothetical protein EN859_006210 [Mesorhizobium sp. M00.F.Ca.ET.216.01.1.1]TIS91093.1 MAG: hypothetical protein E5W89_09010 [Mesorhizobium sp.]TJW07468.1 MAG: hypothetical protein E5W82_23680 [Mesorhizobium sp.]TJW43149.1 MAG: hypothetical protein E5W83_18290 [Mesorhizobium sp.]